MNVTAAVTHSFQAVLNTSITTAFAFFATAASKLVLCGVRFGCYPPPPLLDIYAIGGDRYLYLYLYLCMYVYMYVCVCVCICVCACV